MFALYTCSTMTTSLADEQLYRLFEESGLQVCTDTRKPIPGALFICLKGERFDANTFALEALEAGSAHVLTENAAICNGQRIHHVPDGLKALQDLANIHRHRMQAKVIGIGGSNGKTTTKELLYQVLASAFPSIATQGNLNNHIGVPLTLLRIRPETEFAIVELGTNHPGEMAVVCAIAEPDLGIVTNIGKEHLEGFGSLEGVAKEESELYLSLLKRGGRAYVNAEDENLMRMSARLPDRVIFGGTSADSICRAAVKADFPFLDFQLQTAQGLLEVKASLAGMHNFDNMLAAAAVGLDQGMNPETVATALASYAPANNRSQWLEAGGHRIWLDAYNANPSSMEAALRSFAGWHHSPKIAMLGDMFELGSHEETEHRAIAELAASLGFEAVYLCGRAFHRIASGDTRFKVFPDIAALQLDLQTHLLLPSGILVKGSRGVAMEKVLECWQ
jgi:UDP-N-acetylmuramoyl-tripeptide--D-alanyl-D-alanine ligase